MKRTFSAWTSVFTAVILAAALAVPAAAFAQKAVPRSGGSHPSGGGKSGGGSSGGGQSGSGAPRGGSVQRAPSPDSGGRDNSGGKTVVTRDGSSGGSSGGDTGNATAGSTPVTSPAPGASRPRDGQPKTGDAVARRATPPSGGGTTIFVPGGYYGNYYPWGYGGFGLGGYYGGYDDPWYYGGGAQGYYRDGYEGQLRLKVKPRDAQVFVDGYFAGIVDDFDGAFQRLRIETGPHRIEIRAPEHQSLDFEVRILPNRTVTYTGELKRLTP